MSGIFSIHSLLFFISLGVLSGCTPDSTEDSLQRFEFQEMHMGTDVRIVMYAPDSLSANNAADAAFDRIGELEYILSDYIEDSELNRLSRSSGSGRAVRVSDPLFFLLEKAVKTSKVTGGAFDVTVGPYVELWRLSRRTQRLASNEEVEQAARSVGYEHLRLDRETRSVELLRSSMQLDMGGIGKGYASDEALLVLGEHGIHTALVASAGDIALGNAPPGREGWEIDLYVIESGGDLVTQSLSLSNRAISTSGDLYQFLEIDGARYSHIIDPRTGYGLRGYSFVTVIAPDAVTADSKASAFSVMGPVETEKFVSESEDLEFYFIRRESDSDESVIDEKSGSFRSWSSGEFEKLLEHAVDAGPGTDRQH